MERKREQMGCMLCIDRYEGSLSETLDGSKPGTTETDHSMYV